MSFNRRAPRRDRNEKEIVDALRAAGCLVERISGTGGVPDLLVWAPREKRIVLLEVKDLASAGQSEARLTPAQQVFHERWASAGAPVRSAVDVATALRAVGAAP